jgi:hypothetical protein
MTDTKHDSDSLEMQISDLTMKTRKLEAQLKSGLDADDFEQLSSLNNLQGCAAIIETLACEIITADSPSISDVLLVRYWLQAALNQPNGRDAPEHIASLDDQVLELLGTVEPKTSDEAHTLLRLVRKELPSGKMGFMDGAISNATRFLERHERAAA